MTPLATRALAFLCAAFLALGSAAFAKPPVNDNFADRIVLTGALPIAVTGTNVGATVETGEPSLYGSTSVWWSWTPPANGAYAIDTFGSSFDTVLGVYQGQYLSSLTPVGENDDAIGSSSRLTPVLTGGQEYQIAVVGYQGDTGSIRLNIAQASAISSPLTAVAAPGVPFSYHITATNNPNGFYVDGLPPGLTYSYDHGVISGVPSGDVGEYAVTLTAYGPYPFYENAVATLQLTVSNSRSVISSYEDLYGTQGEPFRYQLSASNNPKSFTATGLPDGLTLDPQTGLISGTPTGFDYYIVHLSATNDDGPGPIKEITILVQPVVPDGLDSSLEVYRDARVHFQITASNDPTSFFAENLPAGLGLNPLTGLISGQPTVAGEFQIRLSATNSHGTGTGTLLLHVYDFTANQFANRTPITGDPIRRYVTTAHGTEEPGEPFHAGILGEGSIWMTWTAPETAQYRIRVDGSLIFAVYTGDSLPTLQEVVSSRDRGLGPLSTLVFQAQAGTVYQIALDTPDGTGSAIGAFTLRKLGANLTTLLHIGATPGGTVTAGFLGNSYRQLGAPYTIEAIPAPGYLFSGWSGSYDVPKRFLTITLQPGMDFTANFIPSPFLPFRGAYLGYLSSIDPDTSNSETGAVQIRLGANGAFTGTVTVPSGTFPFHGAFDLDGNFYTAIPRPGQRDLRIDLSLDLNNPGSALTGDVSDGLSNISELIANRSSFDALRNPTPLAGAYTFIIEADAPSNGYGYGTATVALSGAVRFAGVLPDGAPFSRGSILNDGNTFALYAAAYQSRGSLSGLVRMDEPGDDALLGDLLWIKPRFSHGPNSAPFAAPARLTGNNYAAPPAGTRVLTSSRALNNFSIEAALDLGDAVGWTIDRTITLSSDNQVRVAGSKPLTMTVDPAHGLYRGSFTDDAGTAHSFSGVFMQGYNAGFGLFYAAPYRGSITLTEFFPTDPGASSSAGSAVGAP